MSSDFPIDSARLDQYLAGELPPEDARAVEAALAEHPTAAGDVQALVAGLATPESRARNLDASWAALRTRIDSSEIPSAVPRNPTTSVRQMRQRGPVPHAVWGRRALIAGACAMLALVVISVVRGTLPFSTPSPVTPMATYATATGEQAVVTLRDGSRVTLAPYTTLRVAAEFGKETRTLFLSGEAYLDVTAAVNTPFIVHTGDVTTRVLGTSFDVRRYPHDPHVSVAVAAGKVSVTATRGRQGLPTSMHVTAGRVGVATDSTVGLISTDSAAGYTAWTRGTLVFHRASTREVLETLTRWYGYQFRLADSTLTQHRLTASFPTHSAAQALDNIKLLLDVELTFEGNVVTLHPKMTPRFRASPREPQHDLTTRRMEVGR